MGNNLFIRGETKTFSLNIPFPRSLSEITHDGTTTYRGNEQGNEALKLVRSFPLDGEILKIARCSFPFSIPRV